MHVRFWHKADIMATERNFNLRLPQKLRQLGDIHRNPARLIARKQFRRRICAPAHPRNTMQILLKTRALINRTAKYCGRRRLG
jgi:hypothetical protein